MAAALQRKQLNKLCSSSETFEKAQSILRLVAAKTCPGSGFTIKNTAAIPAICAYLASDQLNTGEVSLQSAMSAACVTSTEFSDILRKVRTALGTEESNTFADVTYETLVDAYHIYPRDDAIGCMKDAEAALPRVDVLKQRYGAHVLSCAIFYWVCHLMEETSVRERALCHSYSISPSSFKAVVTTLDKQCDGIADQIKSHLLQRRHRTRSATRTGAEKTPTPAVTPSKKRTVAFTRLSSDGGGDGTPFPETPTKKRRIDAPSPDKPRMASTSPAKRPSTAAFYAALRGSLTKQSSETVQETATPGAGPSTPRRPRPAKVADVVATPERADAQHSPSRSQGQASPTRPPARRRFRSVFLEQQQWCARDPKVERMWAVADAVLGEMAERHRHPFQPNSTVLGVV